MGNLFLSVIVHSKTTIPENIESIDDIINNLLKITINMKIFYNFGSMNFVVQYNKNEILNMLKKSKNSIIINGNSTPGSSGDLLNNTGIIMIETLKNNVNALYIYFNKYH
jgi:flavodoxin